MTKQQNLEQRLAGLRVTGQPSPTRKAALRAELVSRGRRKTRGRSLAMAVMVVAVFGVTIFDEQPLESFNYGMNYVGTIGYTAYFEGISPHVGNYGSVEGDENGLTPISEERALLLKDDIELFNSLHSAGLTQLEQILGYRIRGRAALTAFYSSLADTLLSYGTESIVQQFSPSDSDWPEYLEFIQNRYSLSIRSTIKNKEVSALRDSVVEVSGVEYPVSIYTYQDSVVGTVLLYHYRRDSTHN